MTKKIKVQKAIQVKGFAANTYPIKNPYTKTIVEPIALYVEGTDENGKAVRFYSPSVKVNVTTGYLNYKTMNQNSWFELIEEQTKGYHGHEMFDNGKGMNVAIQTKSIIVPKIKDGDTITISYSDVDGKMKRVKKIEKNSEKGCKSQK
jgi:hypothetical protein